MEDLSLQLKQNGIYTDDESIIFEKENGKIVWKLPSFPINGGYEKPQSPAFSDIVHTKKGICANIIYSLGNDSTLGVTIETSKDSPFVRLRYNLCGSGSFFGTDGESPIIYGALKTEWDMLEEIQLSHFDRIMHSYHPVTNKYKKEQIVEKELIGPILVLKGEERGVLAAYEHGAESPDHYLSFIYEEGMFVLKSAKGNYYKGQSINDYRAPWIQLGISEYSLLPSQYRSFYLDGICDNNESRKPYIFYNTWNAQERGKYLKGKLYLEGFNEENILKQIDVAHKIGIDVFVIDTGWFSKTGDWEPDPVRFPNGLTDIYQKLSGYGMKLGLWLNPIAAAVSSQVYKENKNYMMEWNDNPGYWGEIWESEESYGMCYASDYSDWMIQKLIDMRNKYGVTYFKWDALIQNGCDSKNHYHGTAENPKEERSACYSYRMGIEMMRIAQEVSKCCGDIIVDYDITEGGRYVGLGFLAAGKYFCINNGPYFRSFDIPSSVKIDPDTINVFFYPGAARSQVMRASSEYDAIIPSVLYMGHSLPEGSDIARRNAAANLLLGGNGIWGDLLSLNKNEIQFWNEFASKYKKVAEDITRSYPAITGAIGTSPEVHEKIDYETGKGAVVFFTQSGGKFTHITGVINSQDIRPNVDGADSYEYLENGSIKITISLDSDDSRVVFIGL